MSNLSPLMSQYREIKSTYEDCILLFRVGDFYETFYEDAVDLSSILNIALTTRDKNKKNPVPLAGVPFHAAENYITRLLASGRKVAVCEQVEDAALAKGLVKREVVEVLTPGTAMNTQLLDGRENNYCLAVIVDNDRVGAALIDVSTGDFHCGEATLDTLGHLVQGKHIMELICEAGLDKAVLNRLVEQFESPFVTPVALDAPGASIAAASALTKQFGSAGDEVSPLEAKAAGALLLHVKQLRDSKLPQVVELKRLAEVAGLEMDEESIANLELFRPLRGGVARATLIHTLDHTVTSMGARTIRHWLQKPLAAVAPIETRLDAVHALHTGQTLAEGVRRALKGIADVQRLAARIGARKAIPRELHALRESLEKVPELGAVLADLKEPFLTAVRADLGDHAELCRTLMDAIVPEPPGHLRDGGVIKRGFDAKLDTLIEESEAAKRWIASLEQRERERSGISGLKVGYNRVFGYYIEVSKAHLSSVPDNYIGKQTLVSAQRFYTQELKDKEQLILQTEEKRVACEQKIFDALCETVAGTSESIQRTAAAVGRIDAIASLATAATLHRYQRPVVDESQVIELVGGRHPVLERMVAEAFVPNDLQLDPERKQFGLITGPNMSGKSTFLRQTALTVVMAQMGSFVPADRARIGVVDKIFTRVGASDRLSRGESTFLVEMNETAHILENMTDRSLVILDEIGRGTSTYDGLSIAWAVTEYLLQGVKARPRTLFATHFHELTQLRSVYPRLVNLKITIREWESGIIFLRKIVPGTSDRSYGIHAARIAGLPASVLKRADEILESLELRRDLLRQGVELGASSDQISLFGAPAVASPPGSDAPAKDDPVQEALRGFDVNESTPLDALQLIQRLKRLSSPDDTA